MDNTILVSHRGVLGGLGSNSWAESSARSGFNFYGLGSYWGYMEVREKKMETTARVLGFVRFGA